MACYRDSFTFYLIIIGPSIEQIRNERIKYYFINICLFVHFATYFDPAGS
jgi:hypothetical protein